MSALRTPCAVCSSCGPVACRWADCTKSCRDVASDCAPAKVVSSPDAPTAQELLTGEAVLSTATGLVPTGSVPAIPPPPLAHTWVVVQSVLSVATGPSGTALMRAEGGIPCGPGVA